MAAIARDGRATTADIALRLAWFFGTSADFWLNLQSQYDADTLDQQLAGELDSIQPLAAAP